MTNINDYLRWRGDIRFFERPFNDVDNLILSTFAYLDLEGIVPGEDKDESIPLAEACHKLYGPMLKDAQRYVCSLARIDATFVDLLGASPRFSEARVSRYVAKFDKDRFMQFAAVCVEMPGAGVYVAFRGTDDSLVGWREDFMLSYEVIASQKEATSYLERAVEHFAPESRSVMVGGHSKGGNLAEYAALTCSESTRAHVRDVYSNDGPGLNSLVVPGATRETDYLVHRIVPRYSVIGMLFARNDVSRLVAKSNVQGIVEHDLTTWQVTPHGVQVSEKGLDPDCVTVSKLIADWMDNLSSEERKHAVCEVFDALSAGGASRLCDIASPDKFQRVLFALSKVDAKTREIALLLVQSVASTSVDAARKSVAKAIWEDLPRLFGEAQPMSEQS